MSEFVGVVLFAMALIWLVALASYSSTDPVWFFNTGSELPPQNFAGRIGAFLAELSFQLLGYTAYLINISLVVVGWHYFWCRALEAPYTKLIGALMLFVCASSFLSLASENIEISGKEFYAGGYVGTLLANFLATYLNRAGSTIFLLTLLFLAIILATQISLGRLSSAAITESKKRTAAILESFRNWNAQRKRKRKRQEIVKKHLLRASMPEPKSQPDTSSESKEPELPLSYPDLPKPEKQNFSDIKLEKKNPLIRQKKPIEVKTGKPLTHVRKSSSKSPAERRSDSFNLPPLALLNSPKKENKINERELMNGARLLEEKCREFSVDGSVVQIHPGPVVTTYEFKPQAGVKYAKITNLAEDLSLAMKAESVLIERIAGKSTVGIQIPNKTREQISLRELLESETYTHSNSKLTLALGKTIHGEPYVIDLATMPHILIAGATGTGKSVAVNAMLTSILYRATPDQVRLIMIDPKRLELGMYEDIPHLMTPVVVDPKQAANALRWAVKEMEGRYKTLASLGVRNIEQYNRNVSIDNGIQKDTHNNRQKNSGADEQKPLPYIVVVIDELADLMMVAGNEVEESIARLAQMARAVGIHLILATQRPSVDVITGLIKANLNARISFRVASKTDSRTILDSNGSERLLGKGDMLFLPPSSSRLMRLHGSYISEQESARLASYLRKQGEPNYDKTITTDEKLVDSVGLEDELYDQAARIIVSSGQASISYLQRRLRVGFSRAARLIDMMELEGLISQGTGGKSREVLVSKDYFDEVDKQLK